MVNLSNPPSITSNAPTTQTAAESSNLRRMQKKELIRQYVSQDGTTPAQSSHLNAFLHFPYSSALAYANEEYLLAGSQRSHWQHQCRNASLLIKSRRIIFRFLRRVHGRRKR